VAKSEQALSRQAEEVVAEAPQHLVVPLLPLKVSQTD